MEITSSLKKDNRIEWVDFAKGIAILLVIIGHSVSGGFFGNLARGLIFSFHMPLFFLLSSLTSKWSSTTQEWIKRLKKSCIHLLIPVLATYAFLIIVSIIKDPSLMLNLSFWKGRVFTLILASGVQTEFAGMTVSALGMPWFLFVLLIGRAIFDYLHLILQKGQLLIISMLLGIAGILLGQFQYLPFSFDLALAVLPFFFVGYWLQIFNLDYHVIRRMILFGGLWLLSLYFTWPNIYIRTYLELAIRRYPLFPLCYLSAVFGCLFSIYFSIICCKLKYIKKPLLFFGKNSLYMYLVHIVDSTWSSIYMIDNHQFLTAFLRIVVDLIAFAILMGVKSLITKLANKKNEGS